MPPLDLPPDDEGMTFRGMLAPESMPVKMEPDPVELDLPSEDELGMDPAMCCLRWKCIASFPERAQLEDFLTSFNKKSHEDQNKVLFCMIQQVVGQDHACRLL